MNAHDPGPRPLVVHHYFPLASGNVGDALVARAIRGQIARHFGPSKFVSLPVNDFSRLPECRVGLRGENLERTNAEADLVIVGGSNLLEPRKPRGGAAAADCDWGVFTDEASLRRLSKPLLLVGMGTGSSFGRGIRPYSSRAANEVRLLHQRALASAVRDVTTVGELARIGVPTTCTGCPVTFLTDAQVQASPGLPLLVSFPPSRIARRWSGRRFMRAAMRYVADLRMRAVPLIVTLHEPRDQDAARDWLPAGIETFHTADVEELIARYQASCGVIGFRLHAALLGLGLGKPVIPVGVDWRGLAMIETYQLHDLSMRPRGWGQFRGLRALTDRLLEGDEALIGRLRQAKATHQQLHNHFLERAAAQFKRRAPAEHTDRPARRPRDGADRTDRSAA